MAEERKEQTPENCDSACASCASANCASRTAPAKLTTHERASIKHAIAIVSGKGGVGKSMVTSLLATALVKAGNKVGILDADITGPSIARAFGVDGKLHAEKDGIVPQEAANGMKLVSTNLVLPDETTPVLWRGTIISGLVKQFFSEVIWGDLDYLLIDMPPGTGDVPLTVYQSLPIDGIVVVTAPQALVEMIVGKAINMAHEMDIPVLGIVENMSYYVCPDCGSKHAIFGESNISELAKQYDIKLTAQLPINPAVAQRMDKGEMGDASIDELADFVSGVVASVNE